MRKPKLPLRCGKSPGQLRIPESQTKTYNVAIVMILLFLIYSFLALIYFKVAFDMSYRTDLAVLAAVLLGILFGSQAILLSRFEKIFNETNISLGILWKSARVRSTISYIVTFSIGRLIIFGFSKDLTREGHFYYESYRDTYLDYVNILIFGLIFLIPILIQHFVIEIYDRQMRGRKTKEESE